MSKLINELSTLSTITGSDQVIVYGTGSSTTGKVSVDSLVTAGGAVMSHDDTAAFVGNTGSETNLFFLQSTLNSVNSTYGGDRAGLIVKPDGLQVWNDTKSQNMWRLSVPVTIAQGGTGATNIANARANLGLGNAMTSNNEGTLNMATSANTQQIWNIAGIASTTTGSTHSGHRVALYITDTGMLTWDAATNSSGWSFKAQGLTTAVNDPVRIIHGSVANVSISANGYATPKVVLTIPSDFAFSQILDVWCDTTGTSSAANAGNVWCTNHWVSSSGSSATCYAVMQNKGSAAAKITMHLLIACIRSSY